MFGEVTVGEVSGLAVFPTETARLSTPRSNCKSKAPVQSAV